MGFLKPGKKTKRARTDDKKSQKPHRVKRIKLEPDPKLEDLSLMQKSNSKQSSSLLERLPSEIIHEIFLCTTLSNLPIVNRHLFHQLRPTKSLKINMLKNYIVDLNSKIVAPEMVYKDRFALYKHALNYRFVTYDILKEVKFDTVLPLSSVLSESKNRLVLYYDKLNQRLLETMRRAESTEEEINRELARIADENFNNVNVDEVELADAPDQEAQDFPERFYTAPFDDDKLEMITFLHTKGLQYINGDLVLCNAMEANVSVELLEELSQCSQADFVRTTSPLIKAFDVNNMKFVEWVISKLESRDLLNHDDLWVYIYQKQNSSFLHYLESQGGTPSHEVLGMLSSSHI